MKTISILAALTTFLSLTVLVSAEDLTADQQKQIKVLRIQARFHTNGDDKDRGDGISESYRLDGTKVVGENRSWGNGIVFHNDAHDTGQEFDVSNQGLTLADINRLTYNFDMDNDDGWKVTITIVVTASDGNKYVVGEQFWNIANGHPRSGKMTLAYKGKA
jgi:hypothetical protein